jgi:hypothetical protein
VATPAAIKIERKIGTPLSSNHYFSQAALPTSTHLQVIEEFEKEIKR